jgi:glutathione S-transferase
VPLVPVDMGAMDARKAPNPRDLSARNPLQRLPVLELDDGTILTESVAICRYFEELHPETGAVRARRARQGAGRDVAAAHGTEPDGPVAQAFRHIHPAMKEWEVPQIPNGARPTSRRRSNSCELLDRELASREFIAGDDYSIADITGMIAVDFMKPARIAMPEDLTNVIRWYRAVSARPSAEA